MSQEHELFDYAPITRSKRSKLVTFDGVAEDAISSGDEGSEDRLPKEGVNQESPTTPTTLITESPSRKRQEISSEIALTDRVLKRGHAVSFAGLFLFTAWVYFRPYELFPAFGFLRTTAFWIALVTILVFVPTQLALENKLTIRPREVNMVLLLLLAALLSIVFATDRLRAWNGFLEYFKIVAIFIVMVNVLRTEKRLKTLISLILVASAILSVAAINDYRVGNLALMGKRIEGAIGGLFDNPNDLALHLVMMIPIAASLVFAVRNRIAKVLCLACTFLMVAGTVVTFSRGGFLGLLSVSTVFMWKLLRSNRWMVLLILPAALLGFLLLAPGGYRGRMATTSDDSASARLDDLKRSTYVSLRHPVFGVGMDNYAIYSNREKATHNAYTQVSVELGLPALLAYLTFLITTVKRLRVTSRASVGLKRRPPHFYLALGLEASLLGYMVTSFFASVAFLWYVYYVVAYAIVLTRIKPDVEYNLK